MSPAQTLGEELPGLIIAAFQEVRRWHPQVTSVRYDENLHWLFTDSHGDAPEFSEIVDLWPLEQAADYVGANCKTFPVYFNFARAGAGQEGK